MTYIYNLQNSKKINYWHFGGKRLLLLTKNTLMKSCRNIWAGPSSPHLDKTKSGSPTLLLMEVLKSGGDPVWTKPKKRLFFLRRASLAHLVCIVLLVGLGTKWILKTNIWPKFKFWAKLGHFWAKIQIFAKGTKSFGTNIAEKHHSTFFALFFGWAWDQMGQKWRVWAKNPFFLGERVKPLAPSHQGTNWDTSFVLKTLTSEAPIGQLGRTCTILTRKFGYLGPKVNFSFGNRIFCQQDISPVYPGLQLFRPYHPPKNCCFGAHPCFWLVSLHYYKYP